MTRRNPKPSPEQHLLQALAPGRAVSGAELAGKLGVTRAAVWKQLSKLRDAGLPVQARTGVGYQLPWPIQLLQLPRIQAALNGPQRAPIQLAWKVDSTQDELRRQQDRLPDGAVILAEWQTSARGRRGRDWLAAPALGLYLSCLKRFDFGPAETAGLSIAMGVCTVQALAGMGVKSLQLHWPNDIVAQGHKLGGILIEVGGEQEGPCVARIGVGINLRLPPAATQTLGGNVTDLAAQASGLPPDRNALAGAVIGHLWQGLERFQREGLAPFSEAHARMDGLQGQELTVHPASAPAFRATGRGIGPRGALRVETADGLRCVYSARVSVRVAGT